MSDSKSIPRVIEQKNVSGYGALFFCLWMNKGKSHDEMLIMCLLCWMTTKHKLGFLSKCLRNLLLWNFNFHNYSRILIDSHYPNCRQIHNDSLILWPYTQISHILGVPYTLVEELYISEHLPSTLWILLFRMHHWHAHWHQHEKAWQWGKENT